MLISSQNIAEDNNQSLRVSVIKKSGIAATERPSAGPGYVPTSSELIDHITDGVIKNSSNNQKIITHQALLTIDSPTGNTMPEIDHLMLDTVFDLSTI